MPLADWKSDLDGIIVDFESTLFWDGRYIKCTASDIREEFIIETDGNYDTQMKEAVASLSRFKTTIPQSKDVVMLDDVKYHVTDKTEDVQTGTIALRLKRI